MGLHTILFRYGIYKGAWTLTNIKFNTSPCCVWSSSETYRVLHDRQRRRFTLTLNTGGGGGGAQSAVLHYSIRREGHVDLLSTEVPESFRGRGVGASLAKAALDFVVEENLKARISCWYIKKYVDENPQHGYQMHIEE